MVDGSVKVSTKYVIPATILLGKLGITLADLNLDTVCISTNAIRKLIECAVLMHPVNEPEYLKDNPDVQAAILSGDLKNATQHYRVAGYYENRLPGRMDFDPDWYHSNYADIAQTFAPSQKKEMYEHYRSSGYIEGRAGRAEHLPTITYWREA